MAEQSINARDSEASMSKSTDPSKGNTRTGTGTKDNALRPRLSGIRKNRKSFGTNSWTVSAQSPGSHGSSSSPSRSPGIKQADRLRDAGEPPSDEDDGVRGLSTFEGGGRFYGGKTPGESST
ncbi:hypothetical protein I302_102336 [Kwoniella bestiolae CBS 10118]|uniref:Uncharacterized protein n=1 Tax=Kwoniella bestiolae CBS 10118 TaxID=1296100 RepID=A0A1B9GEM3_9TREE|nr:hypothetical protein I302_01029 [Kwoniella bestiolae CBS 10118]OCF29522.1 hypothetical protein I302_01029 [Kwoniella bestiolae CBS 10118]